MLEGWTVADRPVAKRATKHVTTILEFIESGETCVVRRFEDRREANTTYNALVKAARKLDCGVTVMRRGQAVYMVMEEEPGC